MKLWYLSRVGEKSWEENASVVVRAKTAKRARQIASSNSASEGALPWRDSALSTCGELKASGEEELVIASNTGA